MSAQSGREVAYRLFAAEYDDADLSYSESDEERAPNYVVTPTGARVNRLFVVGVLTEIEPVSEDVLRARVVDPTGAFVLYAGQYQPDEQAFLERSEPPMFVAITGKARTFQPEDADQVYTSVRPEQINEVDAETRDRWTVQAAEQTLRRVGHAAAALETGLAGDDLSAALAEQGVETGVAEGIALAFDHYGTTPAYLDAVREMALDAARVVAGERDEVRDLGVDPDAAGDVTAADLAGALDIEPDVSTADEAETAASTGPAESAENSASTGATETTETETTAPAEPDDPAETMETSEATETSNRVDSTGSEGAPDETEATAASEGGAADESAETGETTGSGEPAEDLGDFDPEEFDLEDETREEIEEEYGTEFQSGAEVDDPGEADIETPDVDAAESAESTAETEDSESAEPAAETEDAESAEPAAETEGDDAAEQATDQSTEAESDDSSEDTEDDTEETARPDDLQAALLDVMHELDDGDGVDREALVLEMLERYGVDADETDDAIQDALMDGQCYEPDETTLKPI